VPAAPSRDAGRREIVAAAAALALSGLTALVVAQATWVHVLARQRAGGQATVVSLDLPGTQAAPLVIPLAVIALAGALGLVATRGAARRVVGVALALAGAGLVVAASVAAASPRTAAAGALSQQALDGAATAAASYTVSWWWPTLAAVGGIVVLTAGGGAVARAGHWPSMGARFDLPTAAAGDTSRPVDAWTAMDRGQDPTVEPGSDPPGIGPNRSDSEVPE
jgi:hypothetical protein